MERYLETLSDAARRESEAAPHRRDEIIQHYETLAQRYIAERQLDKHRTNFKGFLCVSGIGGICFVAGLAFGIKLLGWFGFMVALTCLANAILSRLRI